MGLGMDAFSILSGPIFFYDPDQDAASMVEISAIVTAISTLILLRHSIIFKGRYNAILGAEASSGRADNAVDGGRSWRVYMITLTKDFLFIVLPTLLFITVLADWIHVFTIFLTFLLCFRIKIIRSAAAEEGLLATDYVRLNVSSYRVIVMILTYLSILAVDFQIFPRRFAKTTYGTSLMDLGVGSFILANAVVSRQARNISSITWKSALISTSAWIALGFARLLLTGGLTNEVHHVGEYGVHWNFFFTLAGVTFLASIVHIRPRYCGVLGLLILIGYQMRLSFGLNSYLLSDERTDLISQNKEGIFPVIGFWGMYLIGVQLGNYLFHGESSTFKMRNSQWARIRICIFCALFWFLTAILDKFIEPVSRKMCNLAYVTFVLAINLQGLATLMLSDLIPGRKACVLEKAVDYNLLGVFLVANVLTGFVNFSVDTYYVTSLVAVVILIAYAFAVCVIAGIAEHSGIKLKVW